MKISILGIFILIAVASATPEPQCKTGASITSADDLSTYYLNNIQNNETYYFDFKVDGVPTALMFSICSPQSCNSQCAVKTIADNGATRNCYGYCDKAATVMGENNYEGITLVYAAGSNDAHVALSCNPKLDPSKVIIKSVNLNDTLLSVVGEMYCSSTPKPYTMTQTFFGQGNRCGNWNILDTVMSYATTCQPGCIGDAGGSILINCRKNY